MTTTEITTTEPAQLGELWQLIISTDQQMACVPREVRAVVQETFKTLWAHIQQQDAANVIMVDRMNHARALIEAQRAGMESLEQQREAIADEYANLIRAMEQRDFFSTPTMRQLWIDLYSDFMEEHNYNFWESLPYDLADMLSQGGVDVDFMDADKLYDILTMNFEEQRPEDWGWTEAQVIEARQAIIKIIRELKDGYDDDAE